MSINIFRKMVEKVISEYQQEQFERISEYQQEQLETKKKERQRESYIYAMDLITSTIQRAKKTEHFSSEQAEEIVKFFMETLKIDLFGYTLISPLFPTGKYLDNYQWEQQQKWNPPFRFPKDCAHRVIWNFEMGNNMIINVSYQRSQWEEAVDDWYCEPFDKTKRKYIAINEQIYEITQTF